jgi:hypothetical protein
VRIRFIYRDRPIELATVNLCHYGNYGDYELFPSEELDLDLQILAAMLIERGYEVKGQSPKAMLVRDNQAMLTLFPTGRMIIEHVKPSTYDEASCIGCRMLEIAGASFECMA